MSAYKLQNAWQKWNDTRDYDSSDVIVRQYKPLVDYHVNRMLSTLPFTISKADIESLGMEGLFEALLKYDPKQDTKFETYASKRIQGRILDGLRKEDRMSRTYRSRYKMIKAAFTELEQKYLREVGVDEVATHLEMTKTEVEEILASHFTSELIFLEEQTSDRDQDQKYIDTISSAIETPEDELIKKDLILEMANRIQNLSDKEQKIISLFYTDDLTFTEIAKVLDISIGRVSQLHKGALAKLKKWLD